MAFNVQVVFDCADPDRLARFWADALGYKIQDPPPGFDSWPAFLEAMNVPKDQWDRASAIVDPDEKGPRLFFQKVPEPKATKNRVHLDVNSGEVGVEAKVDELVAAGATRVGEHAEMGSHWVVMQDPEGNEFCVQ
jgi:Glyoxalase-like domain